MGTSWRTSAERGAQRAAREVEPAPQRPLGDAERRGGVGAALVLEIDEDEGGAQIVRQRRERCGQAREQVAIAGVDRGGVIDLDLGGGLEQALAADLAPRV